MSLESYCYDTEAICMAVLQKSSLHLSRTCSSVCAREGLHSLDLVSEQSIQAPSPNPAYC